MFAGTNENQNDRSSVWEGPPGGDWIDVTVGVPPSGQVQSFDDPPRGRVISIGNGVSIFLLDTVTHSWQHLSATGLPSRSNYSLAFDSHQNRLLLVGGCSACSFTSATYYGDVWQLPLSGPLTWTQLLPGGPMPARSSARAVYDPHADRLLIQGGSAQTSIKDAWALSLDSLSWHEIITDSPQALVSFRRPVMDIRSDRMLFIGASDAWALSAGPPASWDSLTSTPPGLTVNPASGMAFDSTGDRVMGFPPQWSLNLSPTPHWVQLDSLWHPSRTPTNHSAYDADRDRMILWNTTGGMTSVWELPLSPGGEWRRMAITSSGPTVGDSCTTTLDPVGERLIIFGAGSGVWQFSLVGDPVWSALSLAAAAPEARKGQGAIYDAVGQRVVVFGGRGSGPLTNDVWILDLGPTPSWNLATTTGGPVPTSSGGAAIYDPVRHRMIVLGFPGFGSSYETWALSLADMSWAKLNASGPAGLQSSIYDPIGDRMVAFGGAPWAFPLSTNSGWVTLSPGGDLPAGDHANVIYDARRDCAILFDYVSFTHSLNWNRMSLTGVGPQARGFALEAPFPNPSAGRSSLSFVLEGKSPARLSVFDVAGRRAWTRDLSPWAPGPHTIDLAQDEPLRAGLYVVRLQQGDRSASVKAIVLK